MTPAILSAGSTLEQAVALQKISSAPAKSLPTSDYSKSHEEHQYLDLIRTIISTGEHRPDRYRP